MKTVYILKISQLDSREVILDVCTNKKNVIDNINAKLLDSDDVIFKDSAIISTLPKYKFNYSNVRKFMNSLNHRQELGLDVYRFIDDHEKLHVMTIYVQKWNINNIHNI